MWVLLVMPPLFLWAVVAKAPNGVVATGLSLTPLSAPVSILMRMSSTAGTGWQVVISTGLLLAFGVGAVFSMARLLRARLFMSGGRLSVRRVTRLLLALD